MENELRIGNYIYEPNNENQTPFKVWSIYSEKNNNKINGYPKNYFKPVPLTEEWLLKFGFKKEINEMQIDGIEMILPIDDNKTYFSSCGKLGGGLVVLCVCAGNYFANNLEYVHQLQNLFFDLTGKELKSPS